MMIDYRKIIGAIAGLIIFCSVLPFYQRLIPVNKEKETNYKLLSDCDGKIKKLVIQYIPEAAGIVVKIYQQFLTELKGDISIIVICPDQNAFKEFCAKVGDTSGQIIPVFSGHKMTCWSRDRWLALTNPKSGIRLLSPAEEKGAEVWPNRHGDMLISLDLENKFPELITAERSDLLFDGGDFVADNKTVFVTPEVLKRNPGIDRDKLEDYFQGKFGKKTIILPESPPHHAGMFMMMIGSGRVLVGDPLLAKKIVQKNKIKLKIQDPDFSENTCRLFDIVAETCQKYGYRVHRIPVVPDHDGRTYLTYVNVIINKNKNEDIVYLPTYDGAKELNFFAEKTWQDLGYKVIKVDCSNSYRHYGSLRCLVNILDREL